jgi:hypothetical protein
MYRRPRWVSATAAYDDDRPWFEVELTQGKWAKVDCADMDPVIGYCWCYTRSRSGGYAVRTGPRHKAILMHRAIMGLADDDPGQIDHVNGDGLDNRRANLRIASPPQNGANTGKRKSKNGQPYTSRYKGVSWDPTRRKWTAGIRSDGRRRFLGRYESEEDAARAYNRTARELHGQFARINRLPKTPAPVVGDGGRGPSSSHRSSA